MQQREIHRFLERYFTANSCEIVENTNSHLAVQLTIDMDKELMNRPFYWHYLEKTGGVPNPMKMTLITDSNKAPEDLKGDHVHFGSPRMHQIFESTKSLAGYIRLYENISSHPGAGHLPLHPWLNVNLKVSYQCDRKKDVIMSLGIHLITGTILEKFQDEVEKINLTPKIPDFCFTMTPIIKPASGLSRLEHYVNGFISSQDHQWAEDARKRWDQDLQLLKHFYEDDEEKPEAYETEMKALQEQYEPKIHVTIINGGLFYLGPSFINNIHSGR
ncbi:YqhG family protein [Sutcliffiella horikoshii]|uniref:YqhG family protein n=1 Tax=Sutcliffiella horikoshii TaxID=79883 RepID=UPI00384A5E56